VPLVSRQSGLVAQQVGKPRDPSSSEYLFVTVWEDVESVRAFAGEQWQEAVIAPEDAHLLKDTWIGHSEVLEISARSERHVRMRRPFSLVADSRRAHKSSVVFARCDSRVLVRRASAAPRAALLVLLETIARLRMRRRRDRPRR
jgi:hypothetical protein